MCGVFVSEGGNHGAGLFFPVFYAAGVGGPCRCIADSCVENAPERSLGCFDGPLVFRRAFRRGRTLFTGDPLARTPLAVPFLRTCMYNQRMPYGKENERSLPEKAPGRSCSIVVHTGSNTIVNALEKKPMLLFNTAAGLHRRRAAHFMPGKA